MAKPVDKNTKIFEKYVADKVILIADAAATSRAGLAKTMTGLGAKIANIRLCQSYEDAEREIRVSKPHVVICDYDLGARCGLDLLQTQRKERPESKDCLFILVTGNTSQSAVAQAAEEDIDCFVLKPYTIEVLRNSIMRAAVSKIQPSPYLKTIEEGKACLASGKPDEAIKVFEKAKTLDPKPALACFYHGQAELMKKALAGAESDYHQGLDFNKIHYKCMVGLFDLLMSRKMHEEAYDVIKRIARYFPANPHRLNTVLRLAIMTRSYEDIERYYQVFSELESRNEELIKHVCAALVVCGKFYLGSNLKSRALDLFQKAATTASGRTRILREIILALVSANLTAEAQEFLGRFPAETQTGPEFLAMRYLVDDRSDSPSLSIEKGRRLIAQGVHDPLVYEALIARSMQSGLKDSAESLARDAAARFPEEKAKFYSPLQSK